MTRVLPRSALVLAGAFALLAVLVAVRWAPLVAADEAAGRAFRAASGAPGPVGAVREVSTALGPSTWFAVALLAAAGLALRGRRRAAGGVLGLWVCATALEYLTALVVPRDRPSVTPPPPDAGHAVGGSFPSGHALAAVVGCGTVLWLLAPLLSGPARAAAVAVAALVVLAAGCSRVLLVAHWPSDVGGGWLAGAAVLLGLGPRLLPPAAALPPAVVTRNNTREDPA